MTGYLLPEGHFKTNLLTTRVQYGFSTTMFLNALIQYNSSANQWSSNVRFNIIHRPLIAKMSYMISR